MDDTKKLIDVFNVMDSSKCMIEDKLLICPSMNQFNLLCIHYFHARQVTHLKAEIKLLRKLEIRSDNFFHEEITLPQN